MDLKEIVRPIVKLVAEEFRDELIKILREDNSGYMDRKEVAAYISYTPSQIDKMRKSGNFPRPYILTDGGKPLFSKREIDDFVKEHRI